MATATERSALRVAIVGVGPKGLFALERLLDHARMRGPEARLEIDLFEPHPTPAAGPVYDPAQPDYLRMNFAAEQVNMWWPSEGVVPAARRRSFVDWRGSGEGEHYPSRAQVGAYLAEGLALLRRHAPAGVRITAHPQVVRSVDRVGEEWALTTADETTTEHDEVLLAIGHDGRRARWTSSRWTHAAPLIGGVFPVGDQLCADRAPAGTNVAVRGFALTFLDAALALTQGRGGRFEESEHPNRLHYVGSGDEPAVILPFSRSGRPMLAKPDPGLAGATSGLDLTAEVAHAQILALADGPRVRDELCAVLAAAAARSELIANGHKPDGQRFDTANRAARHWLSCASGGAAPGAGMGPAAELDRSLAIGAGLHPPDLQWALGHCWRALYPALVSRLGADGLGADQWPAFRRLSAHLERVAFGPPPVNAAKLLALVAAGRVDLAHVRGGELLSTGDVTVLRGADGEHRVDIVVDAVLPGPGVSPGDRGLLGALVAEGHAAPAAERRGLTVGLDAGLIGPDGEPTPGLSAIGRATEDWVIGNDTLSRGLHRHADGWARGVAERAASERATSRRAQLVASER